MEDFIRQDLAAGASFTLVDPLGQLYKRILAHLCYLKAIGIRVPEVVLFNPSDGGFVTPYNPFARCVGGDLGVAVDRRVTAILRAWGQTNSDSTPRLERWLRCLVTVLIECGLTLVDAGTLIDRRSGAIREQFITALHNPLIRSKFEALSSYKPSEFNEQIESVENRLMRFLTSDTMRRMFGTGRNALDFSAIIEGGKILLINGQPSQYFSREQQRLVLTLALTEIYETALQRPSGARPHYVYVDESHRFITPELAEALETTRQKGIHYCLAAQHLSQFKTQDGDERVLKAIKNCVRNKLVFAIPDRKDAMEIADDVFAGLSDPSVKLVRTRLNHLVEDVRDKSITTGNGSSTSWQSNHSESSGTSETRGQSQGRSSTIGTTKSRDRTHGKSRTFTRGQTSQTSAGNSQTHTENESHDRSFSETTTRQRSSSKASSESETVNRHSRAGLFETNEDSRSISTGGSQSQSESEGTSRTDAGSDSYASGDSYTKSKSKTLGSSKSLAWSRSDGTSEGQSRSVTTGTSVERSSSIGSSQSTSEGTSQGQSQSQNHSVTDQPSARHHPFWEQHEEYWSLEERRWRGSESLMHQHTGCWYASTLAGDGFGGTKLPRKFYILRKELLRLTGQIQERHSMLPEEADQILLEREQALRCLGGAEDDQPTEPAARPCQVQRSIQAWDRTGLKPTNGPDQRQAPPRLSPRKRGPKPKVETYARMVEVIGAYGNGWMEWDNLSAICETLDQLDVPIPDTWLTREPPSRTWRRAFENYPDVVSKVIAYRCNAADSPPG